MSYKPTEADVVKAVREATKWSLSEQAQEACAKATWKAYQGDPAATPPVLGLGILEAFRAARKGDKTPPGEVKDFKKTLAESESAAASATPSNPATEAEKKAKAIEASAKAAATKVETAREKAVQIRKAARESGVRPAKKLAKTSETHVEEAKRAAKTITAASTSANAAVRSKNWAEVESQSKAAEAANSSLDEALQGLSGLKTDVDEAIEEGDITFLGRQKARITSKWGWIQLGLLVLDGIANHYIQTPFGVWTTVGYGVLVLANLNIDPKPGAVVNFMFGVLLLVASLSGGNLTGSNGDNQPTATATSRAESVNPVEEADQPPSAGELEAEATATAAAKANNP